MSAWPKAEAQDDVVAAAREVLADHRALKVGRVLLDATTAGALVAVADALSPENAAKLSAMPIERAVAIVWKLVK